MKNEKLEVGQLVQIPVSQIEFRVGGNTIWIQDSLGGTAFRIKTMGKINTEVCNNSPLSHGDLIVKREFLILLALLLIIGPVSAYYADTTSFGPSNPSSVWINAKR